MTSWCRRRTRLLYALLAVTLVSATLCLFALTILGTEEERPNSLGARSDPGLRPVVAQHPAVNSNREILNIRDELSREGDILGDAAGKPGSEEGNRPVGVSDNAPRPSQGGPPPFKSRSNCSGPWPGYSDCKRKMEWMATNWKKEKCYASNGVDGSPCSFQRYLSEVEHWCPPLPHSRGRFVGKVNATAQYDLSSLVTKMSENSKFDWLQRRISSHWPSWTAALRTLASKPTFTHTRKKILIHIGALSDKAGFKFAENADHGGPLGELVQWSDLIATLHLLGHALEFSTELSQLRSFVDTRVDKGGCPTRSELLYDVIYIDIVGLRQFKKMVKNRIQHYQCLFRVLDSFGTEPQFNYKTWKPPNRKKGDYGQAWGNWNFNPRQFLTMYPHTPDNSFLGFVVGSDQKNSTPHIKKNIGLVYGKELYMWQDKRPYLDLISRSMDIHATVGTTQQKKNHVDPSVVPGYVTNHGILDSQALHGLLNESKVFIGMGFPYEGPAPLEAIASGCVFLNPKLTPPIDRYNSKFLKGKPTLRSLTSQNPYTENFIGPPYVHTFDMKDTKAVTRIMETISSSKGLPGYLPYEFTYEGMLERVLVYLEHQDFCSPGHQWPGMDVLEVTVSEEGESCKDACFREGLVCEPELFGILNRPSALSEEFQCSSMKGEHSVHGPSYRTDTGACSYQIATLLYSCVGSEDKVHRLCPCRTYRKGQVALCSTCGL